jgi:hypothetical protein
MSDNEGKRKLTPAQQQFGNKNAVGNKGGRPRKFQDPDELAVLIDGYFDSCWDNKVIKDNKGNVVFDDDGKPVMDRFQVKPYTLQGLCLYLDCDNETISNLEKLPEFVATIKRARQRCLAYAAESIWNVKNPAGVIFTLKANYGWQDTQNINMNVTTLSDVLKTLDR